MTGVTRVKPRRVPLRAAVAHLRSPRAWVESTAASSAQSARRRGRAGSFDAPYVMPFTHFELRHSGGTAQAGAFVVGLGE